MRLEMTSEQIRFITPVTQSGYVQADEFFTDEFEQWCNDLGLDPNYDVNVSYATELVYSEIKDDIPQDAFIKGVREAINPRTGDVVYVWFREKWYVDVPLYESSLFLFMLRWGGKPHK